jgi:hypothetical protein
VAKSVITLSVGVIITVGMLGCRGNKDSGEESAKPQEAAAPVLAGSMSLAPRVQMKPDESGNPTPVLQLELTDSSGAKKMVDLPPEALKDIGSSVKFSIAFGTPVPGASKETSQVAP